MNKGLFVENCDKGRPFVLVIKREWNQVVISSYRLFVLFPQDGGRVSGAGMAGQLQREVEGWNVRGWETCIDR